MILPSFSRLARLPNAVAAVLVAGACSGGGADADAFATGARVRFRTSEDGPWRAGEVGTIGDCRVVFVPSPSPPAVARRYFPVYPDSISTLQVAGDSALGEAGGWTPISAREVRRRFGGCSPLQFSPPRLSGRRTAGEVP